jgi:WD40 repeat protein
VRADLVLVLLSALGAGFCWQASRPPKETTQDAASVPCRTEETVPLLASTLAWSGDGSRVYLSGNRPQDLVHFGDTLEYDPAPTPVDWSLPGATAVEWASKKELVVGSRTGEVFVCSRSAPPRRLADLDTDGIGIHQLLRLQSGRILAATDDRVVALDAQGHRHWEHRTSARVTNVSSSSDGSRVGVSTSNGQLLVLDGESAEVLHELAVSRTWIHAALSPDGTRAYVARFPGTLCCYDVSTGALLWERSPPETMVFFVAVGPQGRTVFTGGPGSTAHLWSDGGEELESFELADVRTARFSPDGARVAFGTSSGSLMLVDVPLSAKLHNDPGNRSSVGLATSIGLERN